MKWSFFYTNGRNKHMNEQFFLKQAACILQAHANFQRIFANRGCNCIINLSRLDNRTHKKRINSVINLVSRGQFIHSPG